MKNSTFLIILVVAVGVVCAVAVLPDSDPLKSRLNALVYNVTGKDVSRSGDMAAQAAAKNTSSATTPATTQRTTPSQTQQTASAQPEQPEQDASPKLPFDESVSTGSGVADKLLKKANEGDSSAQFSLGRMYSEGGSVKQDMVVAYMWFNLARANGHAKAKDELNLIMKELDNRQIAEGQRLAAIWWDTYKK